MNILQQKSRPASITEYGFRYLDVVTGRWVSRDPSGERGGINLLGFVNNCSVIRFDFLGLMDGPWGPSVGNLPATPPAQMGGIEGGVHWATGGGDVHAPFSCYDPGWGPNVFPGFQDLANKACKERGAPVIVNLTKDRDLFNEGIFTYLINGSPGCYTLRLSGTMTSVCKDGKSMWFFDGAIAADPDRFTFTEHLHSHHRRALGQWATEVGSSWQENGIGTSFVMYFDGERKITVSGFCQGGGK